MTSKIDLLNEYIEQGKVAEVHQLLLEIKSDIEDGDVDLIEYIATPANITSLHNKLCEELGANRRLLQLRARVSNGAHRSALFVQAMINAVGYLQ